MAEEMLNGLEVVVGQKKMAGEGVAKGVRRHAFADTGTSGGVLYGALDMRSV